MDPVASILRSLRLESGLVARAELTGRWGVETERAPFALFHAVVRGRAHLTTEGKALDLTEGDVVVLCRGDRHVLSSDATTPAWPYGAFPLEHTGPIPTLLGGTRGKRTSLICGSFALQHAGASRLTVLLPPVVHLRRGHAAPWLDDTVRLLLESLERDAPGLDASVTRILDAFFVHVLRAHLDHGEADTQGWLAALADPRIARALAIIHEEPTAPWRVAELASRVGMSRSSFFARFAELVGEPPLRYVTRWRMLTAADLLRRSSASVAEVADRVGYGSEHSFSRVFRRVVGVSPGEFRKTTL